MRGVCFKKGQNAGVVLAVSIYEVKIPIINDKFVQPQKFQSSNLKLVQMLHKLDTQTVVHSKFKGHMLDDTST